MLSELLKGKNPRIAARATAYLTQYTRSTFSLITRYEILRGLKAKQAAGLLGQFDTFCQTQEILAITDDIVVLAADLWAALRQKGQLIGDNDLFIAATAVHHGLPLATGNVAHFGRISGLAVDDWTQP
ncbi:MAG TPA: type II toxin-antitoxin system VapC family toxin [Gemmataceae bacterium]|nr:type II toxin-antitoxin system VapC family toxin [Gemmataceae bacterium]